MYSKLVVIAIIALLGQIASVASYDYEAIFEDERMFTPCDTAPDNFLPIYTNFENVTFEFISDDEIICNGPLKILGNLEPTDRIYLEANVMKMERGQWVHTVFTVRRQDVCATLFSPTEIWHKYVNQIDESERACPPLNGHVYTVNNWTMKSILTHLPDPYLNGEYKIITNIQPYEKDGTARTLMCVAIRMRLYRVD